MNKSSKFLKAAGEKPPKDMLYFAQNLSGPMGQAAGDDLTATPAIFHISPMEDQSVQASIADTEEREEEGEQLTCLKYYKQYISV